MTLKTLPDEQSRIAALRAGSIDGATLSLVDIDALKHLVDEAVVAGITLKATQIGPKVAHPTTAEMALPPTDFENDW